MGRNTIIIAEAGVNHNGDLDNAFRLVDIAAEAGADFVKFQTFQASKLVTRSASKADYQKTDRSGNTDETQYAMLKRLELSLDDHLALMSHCRARGIAFLSTAFDLESLEWLAEMGISLAKIPSGELTNLLFLRRVAALFEKVVLSTGMATMQEVREAVSVLSAGGIRKENLVVLHCNTEYPTPMGDVNLKAMEGLRRELGVEVGYSDHTLGIEVPIAAVALGATVIEKHFTLDRTLPGPDHAASLEGDELKRMVSAIRNIEAALSGTGIKEPSASELKNIKIARKSIVALQFIAKGEVFSTENIGIKRPGNGISPMRWDEVIGRVAPRDFSEDELIEL
jgi:N,N'-diacetyllegionaminate synthase